jgi:LuxR family maltose regulon positive regulatory protein
MTVMGFDLSEQQVVAVDARTEGWAAGLQLADLTLREPSDISAAIASFTGSHRFVVDYLVEEVLARQDLGVVQQKVRAE